MRKLVSFKFIRYAACNAGFQIQMRMVAKVLNQLYRLDTQQHSKKYFFKKTPLAN